MSWTCEKTTLFVNEQLNCALSLTCNCISLNVSVDYGDDSPISFIFDPGNLTY